MKTYISYKNQIMGLTDVLETVKATEKISASHIHSLKKRVRVLADYTNNLENMLTRLSLFYTEKTHPLLTKGEGNAAGVTIIFSGDRGLVGGLWRMLITTFMENPKSARSVIAIGAKAEKYLSGTNVQIIKTFPQISDALEETEIDNISNYIFEKYSRGHFGKVDILYPEFISLEQQNPIFTPFLPFNFSPESMESAEAAGYPIFEPSKKEIFDSLLKKHIKMFFHKIAIESKLSELSARTVAMEEASSKTRILAQGLKLGYYKNRKRVITQKQLESFTANKILCQKEPQEK